MLSKSLTRFHSRSAPGISIIDYLRRIVKFTKAEVRPHPKHCPLLPQSADNDISDLPQRSCLLITLHYIDQISVRMPAFVLSSLTCHRFVITSICVSSKCLCDAFHSNSVYAKVGGIPVTELNVLEREFLRMIDWNLTVSLPLLLPPTHLTSHSPSPTSSLSVTKQCGESAPLSSQPRWPIRTHAHALHLPTHARTFLLPRA